MDGYFIVVAVSVSLAFIIISLRGPIRQVMERRRIDNIVNQTEEKHKEPAGGVRDSSYQGTGSTGSDFEKSDLSSSGRSGFSREGRVKKRNANRSGGVVLDKPIRYTLRQAETAEHQAHLNLLAARMRLSETQQDFQSRTDRDAQRHLRSKEHALDLAEKAYETARSKRNTVLVNQRNAGVFVDGRLRTGTIHIIGGQQLC